MRSTSIGVRPYYAALHSSLVLLRRELIEALRHPPYLVVVLPCPLVRGSFEILTSNTKGAAAGIDGIVPFAACADMIGICHYMLIVILR